jgi:hypothetical protein
VNVLTIAMAFDEAYMVPYFIRHYRQLGHVTIYDDHSDDGTAKIARSLGATVLPVESQNKDVESRLVQIKNHAWKPVREQYDWVIVVDMDEFLYHEDLAHVLQRSRELRATVLLPCGYQMVSAGPPREPGPITAEITRGVPSTWYSKPCCFDPKQIREINYRPGAHIADPTGDVRMLPYPGLKLLHCRYMGAEWVLAGDTVRRPRRVDRPSARFPDYNDTPENVRSSIAALEAQATEVV